MAWLGSLMVAVLFGNIWIFIQNSKISKQLDALIRLGWRIRGGDHEGPRSGASHRRLVV